MQNLAKRQWGASLTIKEAADIMIDWCIKAREKNVLRKKPAQIFYAYIMDDTPPMQYLQNIGNMFKYSQKDVPYMDNARDILLRELSVALKAHFFLFPESRVEHSPYFFVLPSLFDPNQTIFGLVYKIEKEDKSIIVCEKDLSLMFHETKIVFPFPAVVIEDSFKWYHMKNWAKIKQQASIEDKPWINKKIAQAAKEAETKEELMNHAVIVDVPFEIKDAIKPLGIEWSSKTKSWYLPKGFDVDSVNEYINYMKKTIPEKKKETNNK